MSKSTQENGEVLLNQLKVEKLERIIDAFLYLIDMHKQALIDKSPTAKTIDCLMGIMWDFPMDEEDKKMFDEVKSKFKETIRPM